MLELMNPDDREIHKCIICGCSPVKYWIECTIPFVAEKPVKFSFCSKCALGFHEGEVSYISIERTED